MEGDFGGKPGADVGDAQFRDEEIGEFPGFLSQGHGRGGERRIGEEIAVEDLEHGAAGAGANDDGVRPPGGEFLDNRGGYLAGFIPIARVEGGLAAAEKVFVEIDGMSQPLEDSDDAHGRLGIHGVHETGDEEGDVHGNFDFRISIGGSKGAGRMHYRRLPGGVPRVF